MPFAGSRKFPKVFGALCFPPCLHSGKIKELGIYHHNYTKYLEQQSLVHINRSTSDEKLTFLNL